MERSYSPPATSILESISDGLVHLDSSWRYTYVNQAASDLLRAPAVDLIGQTIWEAFPSSRREAVSMPLHRAMELREPAHFEIRDEKANRWFECHAHPARDGISIYFRDISEQKKAEEALLESEERFRTLADVAPVLIWLSDTDKRCVYFNKPWLEFTGRTLEEEVGFGWSEGVHPDDMDRCLRIYMEAFDQRETFQMEYRLRRHDGEYRWLLDTGTPRFDAAGRFIGYVGSCTDIHERRHAEEQSAFLAEAGAILASSLDYEATLQSVARLMVPRLADWCAVDIAGPDGSIRQVAVAHVEEAKAEWARRLRRKYPPNPEASQGLHCVIHTGKPEIYPEITDEMLARSALDQEHLRILKEIGFRSAMIVPLCVRDQTLGAITFVWSDSDRRYDQADLHFAEDLARRAAVAVENALLFREARTTQDQLRALNLSLEERVAERTEALTSLNEHLLKEVKEREAAQEALAHANSLLAQRNQELQDFAYVASHDLQEPLRKVRTFAGLLAREYTDRLDEHGLMVLDRLENAAARMSTLITDLLTFSRIATRGLGFEPVSLHHIAEEVLSDLEVSLAETQGKIELRDLPIIEADPLQMRQLLQNLIGNALKFHREGVHPVVRVQAEMTDAPAGSALCRLEVRDNGIGFEEKYLEQIFAPFHRLHSRARFQGTGMGLAICKRIAERHGGAIAARSKPGEGSVFVVTLPARQNTPEENTGSRERIDAGPVPSVSSRSGH